MRDFKAMEDCKFPIMGGRAARRRGYIPMALIRRASNQCHRNHGQSPERLRERGGLSPQEAMAVICEAKATSITDIKHAESCALYEEDRK